MTNPPLYSSRSRAVNLKSNFLSQSLAVAHHDRVKRRLLSNSLNRSQHQHQMDTTVCKPLLANYESKPLLTTNIRDSSDHDSRDALEERSRGLDHNESSSDFPLDEKFSSHSSSSSRISNMEESKRSHHGPVSPDESSRCSPPEFSDRKTARFPSNPMFAEHQQWLPSAASLEEEPNPNGDLASKAGFPLVRSRHGEHHSQRSRPLTPELMEDNITERRLSPGRLKKVKQQNSFPRVISPEPRKKFDHLVETSNPSKVSVRGLEKGETVSQQLNTSSAVRNRYVSPPPKPEPESMMGRISIPESHIQGIHKVFGPTCDLYRDVLQVNSKDASDSQIRVAYFRRGRQILAETEHHLGRKSSRMASSAKAKFHAVTLAYEIASRPEWKASYDRFGWDETQEQLQSEPLKHTELQEDDSEPTQPDDEPSVDSRSVDSGTAEDGEDDHDSKPDEDCIPALPENTPAVVSILRPGVRSRGQTNPSASRNVQWSEEVEELIFERDPAEDDDDQEDLDSQSTVSEDDSADSIRRDQTDCSSTINNKKGTRVIGDVAMKAVTAVTAIAEGHDFQNMFMDMFLNDIDASLDGLEASFSGMMRGPNAQNGISSASKSGEPRKASPSNEGVSEQRMATSSVSRDIIPDDNDQNVDHGDSAPNSTKGPAVNQTSFSRCLESDRTEGEVSLHRAEKVTITNSDGNQKIKRSANRDAADDRIAEHLFSCLTKPLSDVGSIPGKRESSKCAPSNLECIGFEDGWDPIQLAPINLKQRVRSLEFQDAFDPFADIAIVKDLACDEQRPKSPRLTAEPKDGTESSSFETEFGAGAAVSMNTGFETAPVDSSIDTDFLDQKCPCRGQLLQGASDSCSNTEQTMGQVKKMITDGTKDLVDADVKEAKRESPKATETDTNFFKDWVSYMGKMTDLSAIGSHVTEGANMVVNSTQQVFTDTFYLPEDEVDRILHVVSMGLKHDVESELKPTVSRANTY